jgi:DNA-binding transcriptional regulator YhcF (GntR family)
MHTVLSGYQQLRDEGLVELRRGRGATVRSASSAGRAEVIESASRLVEAGRRLDLDDEELVALLHEAAARDAGGVPPPRS